MKISWSLTNRIFLSTALIAILSIGLSIYVVNGAVRRQAEDELRRGLNDAARLVEYNRDLLFEQFAREARLIADLPKLKAAVGVNHPPTVQPIAEDYQAQIGSDVFVVTNALGEVLHPGLRWLRPLWHLRWRIQPAQWLPGFGWMPMCAPWP